MKCLKTGWKCVCRDFHRIHLVDRCLIRFYGPSVNTVSLQPGHPQRRIGQYK
ncbi:hypothetical protein [Enterocloster citroniae]|uniref:hypothetical protein n=1 Tax=Enterocloster citroniae TaxID=358743 RepID=UPI0002D7C75E|nr:hypothetical protein [Enterocloster citroniae]